jgi:hypothetical protein
VTASRQASSARLISNEHWGVTTFHTDSDERLDLTRQALRHTAEAWEYGLEAALDHDVRAARRVMRGAPGRRTILRAAHQRLQWVEASRGRAKSRRDAPIEVVADLMRMNRLLGQLSQTIIVAPEAGALVDHERDDVDAARRIGSKRLWYFAESMPRPTIDREYIATGHDLLDALADLADTAPRQGTTPDVCLALMINLVETSRHATHIA